MNGETVRGVVDRFEGEYAVVVLDDGQQLDWPRSTLPSSVQPGMAVALNLWPASRSREVEGEDQALAQATDDWRGELTQEEGRWIIRLADGQTLHLPAGLVTLAQSNDQVILQDLLDDIFGAAE
ncbi:MAG: DUF3006 domain-containing protein [Anaerolineae bacterium]